MYSHMQTHVHKHIHTPYESMSLHTTALAHLRLKIESILHPKDEAVAPLPPSRPSRSFSCLPSLPQIHYRLRRNELRSESMKKSWRKHRVSSNSRHAHLSDYSRLFIPCPPCSGIFNSVLSEILTRLWLELAPSSRACAHNKPSIWHQVQRQQPPRCHIPSISHKNIQAQVSSRAKLWGQVSGLDFFLTKQWKTHTKLFFFLSMAFSYITEELKITWMTDNCKQCNTI